MILKKKKNPHIIIKIDHGETFIIKVISLANLHPQFINENFECISWPCFASINKFNICYLYIC